MNLWRGLFRLWVGGATVAVVVLLFASIGSALYAPQTNDAAGFLGGAAVIAMVGVFGAWVLRGMKRDPT